MDDFDNLSSNNTDPLADIEDQLNQTKIHIRIQKRNARKHICTVEGLEMEKKELKAMIKGMKKQFACNGNLVTDDKLGFVREERLARYYLNGGDAFRLKLYIDKE